MRVHAHRGNTFTAGTVVLAAAVVEAELRSGVPAAVRVALVLALTALAAFGALTSPLVDGTPRPYQELLLAITALAGTGAVAHGLALAGAGPGDPVDAWWVAGVAGAGAGAGLVLARARSGTIVLGLGAALAVVALVAAVGAAWGGSDPRDGVRWALLLTAVVLVLAIVLRIDGRYRQAVALADVLAAVVVLLAATFLLDDVPGAAGALGLPTAEDGAGAGWQLLLLTAGFALAGLGATLHERGPGWLGALALVASLGVLARDGDGFVGWPLVLGVLGLVLVVVALRPVARRTSEEDDRPEAPPAAVVPFVRRRLAAVVRDPDPDDDLL
ncbi:hypothetical protein [Patulibacter sp.]|uniref:hypothetical protein n=1 Tax=Patulibacter sp. TaxID=1912859 RepID=UPI00271B6DF5|nr:hypothetical protein [Patulibacter sp.]MDO9409087.1 hypothetical protein [Patulibacter sp.]